MVAANTPDARLEMAQNMIQGLKEELASLRRRENPPNVAQACLDLYEYISTLTLEDRPVVLKTLLKWLKDGSL